MRRFFAIFLVCLAAFSARPETIPPAPENHFNDYANVVPPDVARRLNDQLADFERQSSDQIVVAIYPKMLSDSDPSDYAVRIGRAWGVGGKQFNNGAILFVWIQDHKTWIATGYGLEGALPDAICKTIIDEDALPRFKQGDYAGGLTAAVRDIIAAAKGEFKGTGRTVRDAKNASRKNVNSSLIIVFIVFFLILRAMLSTRRRGWIMGSGGWGGWGGGWGGGGGGGGSSGGSFSGGGGSFGGGGAGGSW